MWKLKNRVNNHNKTVYLEYEIENFPQNRSVRTEDLHVTVREGVLEPAPTATSLRSDAPARMSSSFKTDWDRTKIQKKIRPDQTRMKES